MKTHRTLLWALLAIMICVVSNRTSAQVLMNSPKYYPMGTYWAQSYYNDETEEEFVDCGYVIHGTTIIDNKEYYRVISADKNRNPIGSTYEDYAIREEDDKVYIYHSGFGKEFMYYDFDWEEGKGIALNIKEIDITPSGYEYEIGYIKAKNISQIQLNDGNLYLQMKNPNIIQSIGEITGFGGLFSTSRIRPARPYKYFISSFVRNGVEIYTASLKTAIHDLSATQSSNRPTSNNLYDLSGHRLSAPPAKGVFIQDGQKVVR